jgi:hypothetical protein
MFMSFIARHNEDLLQIIYNTNKTDFWVGPQKYRRWNNMDYLGIQFIFLISKTLNLYYCLVVYLL